MTRGLGGVVTYEFVSLGSTLEVVNVAKPTQLFILPFELVKKKGVLEKI